MKESFVERVSAELFLMEWGGVGWWGVCDCRITAANVSVTVVKVKITTINVSISAEESKSHGPGKLISSGGITRAIDLSNNGRESEDISHNYKDSGHKSPHPIRQKP